LVSRPELALSVDAGEAGFKAEPATVRGSSRRPRHGFRPALTDNAKKICGGSSRTMPLPTPSPQVT
jgi:hypothetical protein